MTIDELVAAAKACPVTEEQLTRLREVLESAVPDTVSNEFLERTYRI